MQHELGKNEQKSTTIREIFSHDTYKKRLIHALGHQFQNECSS